MTTRLRIRLADGQVFDVDADKAGAAYPDAEIVAAFERDGDRYVPVDRPAKRTGAKGRKAATKKPRALTAPAAPEAPAADTAQPKAESKH